MKQYNSIKAKYPDALLLFRVGDFYETFGEDAKRCANILDIILTKRANGAASHIELAGFPHHALNTYLPKLVKAGLRVAICDQLEAPSKEKKIVKRGVTELVTPGVALNDSLLSGKSNNFLLSIHKEKQGYGLALVDISTGEFFVSEGSLGEMQKIIQSFSPKEIIYQKGNNLPEIDIKSKYALDDWAFHYDYAFDKITNHLGVKSLKGIGLSNLQLATIAAGTVFAYLDITHHKELQHITSIQIINHSNFVWMNDFTIRNLELYYSNNIDAVTLLDILDSTKTAMGSRLLKRWLTMVLKNKPAIETRRNIVKFFLKEDVIRSEIRTHLQHIPDLERLIARISSKRITPKQMYSLLDGLEVCNSISERLNEDKNEEIAIICKSLNPFYDLRKILSNTLTVNPPHFVQKGNVIKQGVSKELDSLRDVQNSGKDYLEELCKREEQATGIPKLKIAFNNVFGYYLEVRNTHKDKVPENWHRKQTLVNAERYITNELKEYETKILSAEEKILALEQKLFDCLIETTSSYIGEIQKTAATIAQLDVLTNFSEIAEQNHYTMPELNNGYDIHIEEGRHPVIEKQLEQSQNYVSNNVFLSPNAQQIIMITGPNMSGKSALLRQTALIVIMAQIGSYVPAKNCKIGIIDKIFTRVGASDNLTTGESTFMVEMNETASILNNLSDRSLILLDEIGRGTSTYDGISIAWSIAEYLHEHKTKPKTLFATHYHELNEMSKSFHRIKNFNVSVKETKEKVIFLRKLVAGGSEHSFGIHVAKLAGMPKKVLSRANDILSVLENSKSSNQLQNQTKRITTENLQLSFFQLDDPILEAIRDDLIDIDVNTLTPVEALLKLNEIKMKIGR